MRPKFTKFKRDPNATKNFGFVFMKVKNFISFHLVHEQNLSLCTNIAVTKIEAINISDSGLVMTWGLTAKASSIDRLVALLTLIKKPHSYI